MPEDGTAPETLDAERVSRLLLRYLDEGKETRSVLQEILVTLRQSNIVPRGDETKWVRFWNKYNQEADEYDREFLQRYKEDMNTTMIFSGLFTAVTATIASMTISNLSQDPNLFTQVLLHNIFVSLNHTGEFIHMDIPLSPWTGPSVSVVWSQTFLYASLVCSLLVALGAVLATQWLSRYNAVDERGTVEDRGKRRQQKFDGLKTWYFRTFLEALPILLQFSLLLFGISLCAYMWAQQRAIAAILIFANGLAGLLWLYTVVVSAIYPESPYDTPLSDLLAAKRVKGRGYNGGPTSALVSSIRLSGIFNAIREHIQTAYSAIIAAATAGVHGRVNERPHSLRRDVVRTERTDLEQAGSPAHTAATRIHLIQPLRNGLTTIYARVSPPVRHVSHYVAHNSIGILSRISAPIVNTHKKRLARSYPTINDVRIAAFTWLLQTSTDPEVHINAFLIVPEMVWTDEMFTNSFSLKSLDFILDKLVSCFDWDGRPKSDSFDRTVSLLTTFLFVYWQLYRTSPDRTHAWTREKGRAFASGRAAIVDTLRSLDLTTYSRSASETWVLRHAYLTFQHFTETRSPLKLVQVNFAISTSSLSQVSATYLESPPSSPFTASLRLRTFSLLYLAQASHVGAWWDQSRGVLFAQIEEYFDALAVENTRSFSLLATALILGYETQQIVTPDWSHSVDWPSAVGCVLLEMWGYVQWRAYEDESGDLPPFAFTQEPAREVHLSKASLILLSRILRILHSAVPTLPESWTPPSSRCEWLSLLVHRLCTSEEVAREVVYRGVTHAVQVIVRAADLSAEIHRSLSIALDAAAKLKFEHRDNHDPSTFHAFLRMQRAILALILSFALKGFFRHTGIPTFSPESCPWDPSHPRFPAKMTELERDLLEARDTLFVEIFQCTAAGTEDTSSRRAWFNDMRNDSLIRMWIYIAHRWMVDQQSHRHTHIQFFSLASLLECDKFRLQEASHWGDDLGHVQQLVLVALLPRWYKSLQAANNGESIDFSEMAESTLHALDMDERHAAKVHWYIETTLDYLVRWFPSVVHERSTSGDSTLMDVEAKLAAKLITLDRSRGWGREEHSIL